MSDKKQQFHKQSDEDTIYFFLTKMKNEYESKQRLKNVQTDPQPYKIFTEYNQNTLSYVEEKDINTTTIYVPAYVRCHFRNMTEMDIQNLSSKLIATMNISFYLGKYSETQTKDDYKKHAQKFAEKLNNLIIQNLKVIFQNDFVMNLSDDISTNVSDSDRLVRADFESYRTKDGITRSYTDVSVTRQFKFGLRSDIFLFPLEQNVLDLVTTLHEFQIEQKFENNQNDPLVRKYNFRFNCMNVQIKKYLSDQNFLQDKQSDTRTISENQNKYDQNKPIDAKVPQAPINVQLNHTIKQLYMHEKQGKELDEQTMNDQFINKDKSPFFRYVKMSFPQKKNATEFGYYNIVEDQIKMQYTNKKQYVDSNKSIYTSLKNCLFCKKQIISYNKAPQYRALLNQQNHQNKPQFNQDQDQGAEQQSFCNAIMSVPMLKASLGTIIQLYVPIFFLSFLTIIQFLYSHSTSSDQVRGQKIGASTLIVATYISFIYAMRTVIPPTPSWSIFEVVVCILAGSSLFPIIQSIYASNSQDISSPFESDPFFIVTFALNVFLCICIILMLVGINIYMGVKTDRTKLIHVTGNDILDALTKKNFYLWRNDKCRRFMITKIFSYEKYKHQGHYFVIEK